MSCSSRAGSPTSESGSITFGPREQFSWEIVWVRAGALDLEIDDRRVRLRASDVAIVPPGAVDRYEWTRERRVVHSFVHFDLGPAARGRPSRERWPGRSKDEGNWCNPDGRALGTPPTITTGEPLCDAFYWIKPPGESDGTCNKGPSAGAFWPDKALEMAKNAKR